MTRAARPRPPRTGDPYGVGPIGTVLAPVLSLVGLLLIGIVTLNLLNGEVPFGIGGSNGNGGNVGGPARTPAPSNEVVVPEEAAFEGSIVYAKAGNIWVQTNEDAKQLTSSGGDSMPSWSSDGEWIYYIRSTDEIGYWPFKGGRNGRYDIQVPDLMRVRADGSAEPEQLATGFVKDGRLNGRPGCASPSCPRTARRSPSSRTPRTRATRTSSSSSSTSRRRSSAGRRQGERRARPPGPGVAARRSAAALHPERPGWIARRAA